VAYWHSPPHFLWEPDEYFRARSIRGTAFAPMLAWLRRADREAERRVDIALANSRYTADRLEHVYGRKATVVYPAVGTAAFSPAAERSGRFLVVSRLRRHKRLDLAVEAATRRGWGLDIIGEGPDEAALRKAAGPTIRFLGRRSDAEVAVAMSRCVALVVPGIEDFGLTMPEVQAAGRPPVAFGRGGALEIIRDGGTGFTFGLQTVDGLIDAMERALATELDAEALVRSARRFDRAVFDRAIGDVVAGVGGGPR
jgi:glycosyltransferase involved in cell wall biosynthesis